jgi:hypothetical protein
MSITSTTRRLVYTAIRRLSDQSGNLPKPHLTPPITATEVKQFGKHEDVYIKGQEREQLLRLLKIIEAHNEELRKFRVDLGKPKC